MPTESGRPTISQKLKQLIKNDERSLTEIASLSGVDYETLRKWFKGDVHKLDVENADKVHQVLTNSSLG